MIRVIATRTDANWDLVEEDEFITDNEVLKNIFLEFNWVKPYDDNCPLPPKGINDYEEGMSYPKDRFIIMGNSIFQSNCITSTTLVRDEWDVKVQGA